jgi:hypothetical protein
LGLKKKEKDTYIEVILWQKPKTPWEIIPSSGVGHILDAASCGGIWIFA